MELTSIVNKLTNNKHPLIVVGLIAILLVSGMLWITQPAPDTISFEEEAQYTEEQYSIHEEQKEIEELQESVGVNEKQKKIEESQTNILVNNGLFEPRVCDRQYDHVDKVIQQASFTFKNTSGGDVNIDLESENELSSEQLQLLKNTTEQVYNELITDGYKLPSEVSYCVKTGGNTYAQVESRFSSLQRRSIHLGEKYLDNQKDILRILRHEWTHIAQFEQGRFDKVSTLLVEGLAEHRAYDGECPSINYVPHPLLFKEFSSEHYRAAENYRVGCVAIDTLKENGTNIPELLEDITEYGQEEAFDNASISWKELENKTYEQILSNNEGEAVTLISQITEINYRDGTRIETERQEFSNGLSITREFEYSLNNNSSVKFIRIQNEIFIHEEYYNDNALERLIILENGKRIVDLMFDDEGEIQKEHSIETKAWDLGIQNSTLKLAVANNANT